MALAGSPVCATGLRLTRLQVATSIHVVDSLGQGLSHFLSELHRLVQALDLAGQDGEAPPGPPLLGLFDEILHGTNSRERSIGARALARRLVDLGAIGILSTHDLALAALADELGERSRNLHLSDRVENGAMIFDYTLRDGVLPTTNALRLMRSIGLDLPYEDQPLPTGDPT